MSKKKKFMSAAVAGISLSSLTAASIAFSEVVNELLRSLPQDKAPELRSLGLGGAVAGLTLLARRGNRGDIQTDVIRLPRGSFWSQGLFGIFRTALPASALVVVKRLPTHSGLR